MATPQNTAQNTNQGKKEEEALPNELRVGQRRTEAYVKQAEQLFLNHEEINLCGLGNSKHFPAF